MTRTVVVAVAVAVRIVDACEELKPMLEVELMLEVEVVGDPVGDPGGDNFPMSKSMLDGTLIFCPREPPRPVDKYSFTLAPACFKTGCHNRFRALVNQLDNCLTSIPACIASSSFSSSVGYG